MAVIMKIRNKLGILMVFVIGLAIVAFLLMDSLSSNSSLMNSTPTDAGSIDGNAVSIQDFEIKVQEAIENYKNSAQQVSIDEQTMWQLREETWNQYLNEVLMKREYDKLGVQVTSEELQELLWGSNPHPAVRQSFTDPNTGFFDPAQVRLFVQRLDQDETGETRKRWLSFEKFVKEDRLRTKYNLMIRKGVYVPAWQAKEDYQIKGTKADIEYIYLPYADIPDDQVTVTDGELRDYMKSNKKKYEQKATRTLEYVSFDILPTDLDTIKAKTKLLELKEKFSKTVNDSVFVKLYSDRPFDHTYHSREDLKSSIADTFFVIDTGSIISPYLEDSTFIMAKLLDRKQIPDSVKARQIYIAVDLNKQGDAEFKRSLIDSVKLKLEAGGTFTDLALQYSDDEETKFNGGDMGWIKPGSLFSTINDALFFWRQEGDLFVVGSNTGFHLIEITKAKPTKTAVKVAFLTRDIVASLETERALYAKASEFAGTHSTSQEFKAQSEYNIRTAESLQQGLNTIAGLGSAREMVKWAFNAEENEVSEVFSLDKAYVVAHLAKLRPEGTMPLEDVRQELEFEVKKQKKAELLKAKIQGADINAIASSLGVEVLADSNLNLSVNPLLTNIGSEVNVIGVALSMNKGETSAPVAGNNGVFVVKVIAKTSPETLPDYSFQKRQLLLAKESGVDATVSAAIKEAAEIVDERYKFY